MARCNIFAQVKRTNCVPNFSLRFSCFYAVQSNAPLTMYY